MYDAMVEFDQMWFIFQRSLPCGPYTSSISVAVLGFPYQYRSAHLDPRKKSSAADMTSSSSDLSTASQPSVFIPPHTRSV